MSNFANLNKGQLRQAMRDAGLSYSGLSVQGMREVLEAHTASDAQSDEKLGEAVFNAGTAEVPEAQVEVRSIPGGEPNRFEVVHTPRVLPTINPPASTVTEPEAAPVVNAPRATSKGVKIEKDRPMQNGVKMPSAGSLCRAVWDELQRALDAQTPHTAKTIKEHAGTVGWNVNNASIEFYNWRKFHGIQGRSK